MPLGGGEFFFHKLGFTFTLIDLIEQVQIIHTEINLVQLVSGIHSFKCFLLAQSGIILGTQCRALLIFALLIKQNLSPPKLVSGNYVFLFLFHLGKRWS